MASIKKITSNLKSFLKDFTDKSNFNFLLKNKPYRYCLSYNLYDYDKCRLIRYIFSKILCFKIEDRPMEKINWWISFFYKNKYKCAATHEKFGFRIYVESESEEISKKIAREIENKIFKAIDLAMPLMKQQASKALKKGEIIVDNNFNELYNEYNFFKEKALLEEKELKPHKSHCDNDHIYLDYKMSFEKKYFEKSAYFNFYSTLEHLCILFLAFKNIPERNNINEFLIKKWGEKFKIVFNLKNSEFKDVYEYLKGLAKYQRNPSAHGNTNMTFSFFLEEANHKISILLPNHKIISPYSNKKSNFDVLERFFKLLKNDEETRNIFMYIKSGLNVDFNTPTKNDAIINMTEYEIKEYLEAQLMINDNMANMDW